MTLMQEIQGAIEAGKARFEREPRYVRLTRYLEVMRERNLVRPQEYGLPLVDTVGPLDRRTHGRIHQPNICGGNGMLDGH